MARLLTLLLVIAPTWAHAQLSPQQRAELDACHAACFRQHHPCHAKPAGTTCLEPEGGLRCGEAAFRARHANWCAAEATMRQCDEACDARARQLSQNAKAAAQQAELAERQRLSVVLEGARCDADPACVAERLRRQEEERRRIEEEQRRAEEERWRQEQEYAEMLRQQEEDRLRREEEQWEREQERRQEERQWQRQQEEESARYREQQQQDFQRGLEQSQRNFQNQLDMQRRIIEDGRRREQERQEREQRMREQAAERQRQERERRDQQQRERERQEQTRRAQEEARREQQRLAQERREQERQERERREQERREQQRREQERLEQQRREERQRAEAARKANACHDRTRCFSAKSKRPTGAGHCEGEVVGYFRNSCNERIECTICPTDRSGRVMREKCHGGPINPGEIEGGELSGNWWCGIAGQFGGFKYRCSAPEDSYSCREVR